MLASAVKPIFRQPAPLLAAAALTLWTVGAPGRLEAVVIGQRKPVCEQKQELEGPLYVEVIDLAGGDPRYVEVRTGGTDPVVLTQSGTYRMGLRLGATPAAPAVPARYRVEGESFLTFRARGDGRDGLPLEREFSINALDRLVVHARNPGRRKLFLRVSECWTGGGRYLHAPAETVVPVVVIPREEGGGPAAP
jgi:hypothetical protein